MTRKMSTLTVTVSSILACLAVPAGMAQPAAAQPAARGAAPQATPPPASEPAPPASAPIVGPMRVEQFAILEQRVGFVGAPPERAPKSSMRAFFKLTGERLPQIVKAGKLVIDEMTDDSGAVLVDPASFDEAVRKDTNPVNIDQGVLTQGYLMLDVTANPVPRSSKKIAVARGYVNVVYGGETVEVSIENPLQYEGKVIDHPKLRELGVTLRVLTPGEAAQDASAGKGISIKAETGEEQIKSVDFYDDWLKKMSVRSRPSKTAAGESYTFHAPGGNTKLDADCTLVLTVFKTVERQKIELNVKDWELP